MGINEDCTRRYRDRKNTMNRHFKKFGGYNDVDEAKKHPHSSVAPHDWVTLIDRLFQDPEYKARSIQNSKNRAQMPYSNVSGSKSFAQRCYEEVQEKESINLIGGWREMHTSKGTWVNDNAQQDWIKIQNELTRMQEEAGKGQEVDEGEVLRRAFGERRGRSRGGGG